MRFRSLSAAMALCACALALAAFARADEFADFRIPDNRYLQWTGSLSGNASSSHQTQGARHGASGYEALGAGTWLRAAWDGEARYSALDMNFSGTGLRSRSNRSDRPAPLATVSDHFGSERIDERLDASWDNRWYLGERPFWLGARLGAQVFDRQNWSRQDNEIDDRQLSTFERSYQYSYSTWTYANTQTARVAWGAGRVRNATGIYEARTLEQRLRAAGALVRPLAPETRQKLAGLMYARSAVSVARERPAEIVWAEIAGLLRGDGALRDSALSAADGIRLVAPYSGSGLAIDVTVLPLSPVVRQRGSLVSLVFDGAWGHSVQRSDRAESEHRVYDDTTNYDYASRSSFRQVASATTAFAGPAVEFHRPISLALQFDAAVEWLFDVRPGSRGTRESANASLDWIVADRWLAGARISQRRSLDWRHSSAPLEDGWTVAYGGRLEYHVTDHMDATLDCNQQHSRTVDAYYGPTPIFARDARASFGLTYRFAGYANIAGMSPALAP